MSDIGSFSLTPVSEDDIKAYNFIDINTIGQPGQIPQELLKNMGYDPMNILKNKQLCKVCDKSGPECIGHPVGVDLCQIVKKSDCSSTDPIIVSELSDQIFTLISRVFCRNCGGAPGYNKQKHGYGFSALVRAARDKVVNICCDNRSVKPLLGKKSTDEKFTKKTTVNINKRIGNIVEFKKFINRIDSKLLDKFDITKENILNFFTSKVLLLPVSLHVPIYKDVTKGQSENMNTKMLKLQMRIFDLVGESESERLDKLNDIMQMIVIGNQRNTETTPSHIQACSNKTGLWRGSGICKRATSTGRGVLTPSQGNSGVLMCPRFIADNIKVEVVVAMHNILYLQNEVGKEVTHIVITNQINDVNIRSSRKFKKVSQLTVLKLGDIVLRSLTDGDKVVFNRHPTLHTHSLIGYEIKVWNKYCFGLHQTNAPSHGADFDGDEGNIRIADNSSGRIETSAMDVKYKTFGVKSGEPAIGITYNGIIGAYLLSLEDNLSNEIFIQMRNIIRNNDEKYYKDKMKEYGIPYYSGRTLISMILPKKLNYIRESKIFKGSVGLHLKNGIVLSNKSLFINVEIKRGNVINFTKTNYIVLKYVIVYNDGIHTTQTEYIEPNKLYKGLFNGERIVYDGDGLNIDDHVVHKSLYSVSEYEIEVDNTVYNVQSSKSIKYDFAFGDLKTSNIQIISGSIKQYDVEIENGILLYGRLRSSDVSDSTNGIIATIGLYDKFIDPYMFINKGYQLFSYYASIVGVTISVDEYIMDNTSSNALKNDIESQLKKINQSVLDLEKKKEKLSQSSKESIESIILSIIGRFTSANNDKLMKIQQLGTKSITFGKRSETYTHYTDLANITYGSGARGSIDHVRTVKSVIGQQFSGRGRLMQDPRISPYSKPYSKEIKDNGFINNNYSSGLSPSEVVAMSIPARVAAYNVYVGTPDSGAISRQINLHLNGIIIDAFFGVVGRDGMELNSLYGTGADPFYASKKDTPLGKVESCLDMLSILNDVNTM